MLDPINRYVDERIHEPSQNEEQYRVEKHATGSEPGFMDRVQWLREVVHGYEAIKAERRQATEMNNSATYDCSSPRVVSGPAASLTWDVGDVGALA